MLHGVVYPRARSLFRCLPLGLLFLAAVGPGFAQFHSVDRALRSPWESGSSASEGTRICSPAPGEAYAVWFDSAFTGEDFADVLFSRTIDGGANWTGPDQVSRVGPLGMAFIEGDYLAIACDESDRVFVAWVEWHVGESNVYVNVSGDGGASWLDSPIRLGSDLSAGEAREIAPHLCTDEGGKVYGAWVRADEVWVGASADAGASWSGPVRIDDGHPAASDGEETHILASACLPGGEVHVVWETEEGQVWTNGSTGSGAEGTWNGASRLDEGPSFGQALPRVAAEAGGRVYAVWEGDGGGGGDHDIYFSTSSDSGLSWGTPERVDHAPAGTDSSDADMAVADGRVFVAWEDFRDGAGHVYFNRRSPEPTPSWGTSDTRLDPTRTSSNAYVPSVTACGSDVGVAWVDSAWPRQEPFFNRSFDAGATWAGEEPLTTASTDGMFAQDVRAACGADVTETGWYAVWNDNRSHPWSENRDDVFASSTSDQQAWPVEKRLDGGTSWDNTAVSQPRIASDDSGRVYAVWADERVGFSGIYFNRSLDYGETWLPEDVDLEPGANRTVWSPEVCADGWGCVYVTWHDSESGSDRIFFTRSCDDGESWIPIQYVGHAVEGTVDCLDWYDIECDEFGNVYVVWADDRATSDCRTDVYFNMSHDRGGSWWPSDQRLNDGVPAGTGEGSINLVRIAADEEERVHAMWRCLRDTDGNGTKPHSCVNSSWDAGQTWLGEVVLDGSDGRVGLFASIAADEMGGVFVAWPDYRNGAADVFVSHSLDYGFSWEVARRVDVGDPPGANTSYRPAAAADAGNVIVAWVDDRNGEEEIFVNRSLDQGENWLASAIRVDGGDAPGAHRSALHFLSPLAVHGDLVRVTWVDDRNGWPDTYLNFSDDAGTTWHDGATRVEAGEAPGAFSAAWANLSISPDGWTHVVWLDHRDGYHQVRANSARCLLDDDGDGRCATSEDCDDGDETIWSAPAMVAGVTLEKTTGAVRIHWSSQDPSAGPGTAYDVVTGRIGELRSSGGYGGAGCLAPNLVEPPYDDTRTAPPSGDGEYYLVRAGNGCGIGSYGDSGGTPDPRDDLDGSSPCP